MPWTIIINENDVFRAVLEVLSFDSCEAWDQAREKHTGIVGMLKGSHAIGWITHA